MKLTEVQRAKADQPLQEALRRVSAGERIRAIIVLGNGDQASRVEADLQPSQFPSRAAWREALTERREEQLAHEFTSTLEALRKLSLRPHDGEVGRMVVVEGPAQYIALSLVLPGVSYASLDRSIELIT